MKQKLTISTEILDRVVYGMENQKEQLFLDPTDGTLKQLAKDAGLIPLPPWDSSSGYRLMDNFITSLPDRTLAARLRDALDSGTGVFRRFKDILSERPLNQQLWRQFKKRVMRKEAYNWLSRWSDFLELSDLAAEPEDMEDLTKLEFTLRSAAAGDLRILERWDREAQNERYPALSEKERDNTTRWERGNSIMELDDLLVAETLEGQMVGFSWIRVRDGEGWLLQLFILPEFRGMGVSKMLLDRSFDRAVELGAIRLGVYQTDSGIFLTDWLKRNGFQSEVVAWTKQGEYY